MPFSESLLSTSVGLQIGEQVMQWCYVMLSCCSGSSPCSLLLVLLLALVLHFPFFALVLDLVLALVLVLLAAIHGV